MLYILGETLATSREQLREEVVWFEEGTFFEYLKDFPIKGKNYMIFPRMVFFLKGHVNQTNRALYSPKDCLINIQNLFRKKWQITIQQRFCGGDSCGRYWTPFGF